MPTKATPRKSRKSGGAAAPKSHSGSKGRKWSGHVTETSDAMTLKGGVFKSDDPKEIARSVKQSSEASRRRKSNPYRSAVSMISFYENRGGKNLSGKKKKILQNAKKELKREFGRREN
jgi:Protein of unknown function (DUF3175)